jgi:predicted TPR repeat methyltransferase
VLQVLGRGEEAFRAFERAMQIDPDLEPPYVNLGHLLERSGRTAEACALYARAHERGLTEGLFQHHLAAAARKTTSASPPEWVRSTFDNFAPSFDAHLRQLGYSVPEQLAAMLLAQDTGPFDIVDLGCGTGLCGQALTSCKRRLVGVDLSERMLVEARRLNVYDALYVAEIQAWLAQAPAASCDVLVAADVFIYIGALEEVFAQVHRMLRLDGWVAFSIEEFGGTNYRLQPTGRYAQSCDYVHGLAGTGFTIAADHRCVIRKEDGVPVDGCLYLLRRRPNLQGTRS